MTQFVKSSFIFGAFSGSIQHPDDLMSCDNSANPAYPEIRVACLLARFRIQQNLTVQFEVNRNCFNNQTQPIF